MSELPEQPVVENVLEARLTALHKEIGWRMAMANVLRLAVEYRDLLPPKFKDELVNYHIAGFPPNA